MKLSMHFLKKRNFEQKNSYNPLREEQNTKLFFVPQYSAATGNVSESVDP